MRRYPVKSITLEKPIQWIGMLVLLALALAACQPAATAEPTAVVPVTAATATTAPTSAPTEAVSEEPVIAVSSNAELGDFLVDGNGMTLYMFTKDEPNKSNCAGNCLAAWPPLLSQGSPQAGEGVDQALLGTAEMPDGTLIVTYNEMPLYYWMNDAKAGDVTGQANNDVWWVVSPAGDPIGMPATEATQPSATEESTGEAATGGAMVNLATDPTLGEFLVDDKGMTLYMFSNDEPDKSNCSGNCLVAWPPFLSEGEPQAGDGVDQSLLGTTEMPDGTLIVTYNHMPLYYWMNDTKAGDVTGQGNNDVWWVVSPAGDPIGQ